MVFSSLLFLFRFLPVVLVLYYLCPDRLRNALIFASSLIFYAWGEPVYVVLMLFSTVVDFNHGLLVERFKREGRTRAAKAAVASSMVINLALLGFFKYTNFFLANLNALTGLALKPLDLTLPIGISFYTFQTMSYTIDVYRGEAKAQHNIITFGAYVSLFPQLIAGPIVQYKTVAEQMDHRELTVEKFSYGVTRFVNGLGKKVLLANAAGLIWDAVSASELSEVPVLTAWLGIAAYTFQIYFDFSGYSDMAIGLGSMLGFRFLENFNYPYESKSVTEFWRRWHISLGSWFRDYVYIPLGGNRQGLMKQLRNIGIVWLLTGLWHGASWNFVLWGVYFGVLLVVEKTFLLEKLKKAPAAVGHLYTMFFVVVSWVIFALDDIGRVFGYLGAMFGASGTLLDGETLYLLSNNAILLVILAFAATSLPKKLAGKLTETLGGRPLGAAVRCAVFLGILVVSTAYLVDASYNPFLYFRF